MQYLILHVLLGVVSVILYILMTVKVNKEITYDDVFMCVVSFFLGTLSFIILIFASCVMITFWLFFVEKDDKVLWAKKMK